MGKNQLIGRGFLDALGVAVYVTVVAWFINNLSVWFGQKPDSWLAPALMLLIFIISACVTGSLVLLKPVLLYIEGDKKGAASLFAYTVVFLALLALLIGLLIGGIF